MMNAGLRSRLLNSYSIRRASSELRCALLHGTPAQKSDRDDISYNSVPTSSSFLIKDLSLYRRFTMTFEVIISKIFPAGFGWQAGSVIATDLGYASDSLHFALSTGLGDALGVLLGHSAYYGCKKVITSDGNIHLSKEVQTGIFLSSAAFCSGSLWQPLVLNLQSMGFSFNGVMLGAWVGCGSAFYLGLRINRMILPRFLEHVEKCTEENKGKDATLALSIGGATGFFVGTDTAYLPTQNFLIDIVGIHNGASNLTSCAIAGSSTSLGFITSQTLLNFSYPKGKCWND